MCNVSHMLWNPQAISNHRRNPIAQCSLFGCTPELPAQGSRKLLGHACVDGAIGDGLTERFKQRTHDVLLFMSGRYQVGEQSEKVGRETR